MYCLNEIFLFVSLLLFLQYNTIEAQNNSITVNFTVNGVDPNLELSKFASDLPSNIQIQSIVDDIQVAVVPICPYGYYCPTDTTVPVPCPAGTYFSGTNANNVDQCLPCTRGSMCPTQATVTPTPCPAGTFCTSTGTVTPQTCQPGKYCPFNSTTPTNCSINTYRVGTGASSASDCISCPSNTVGPSGSTTILNCRCVTGYVCTYTKTITATVTLNTTYPAFDQNVGGVRTAFQQAIANAAGVAFNRVSILGFATRSSNRRRMLSVFSGPDVDSGLVVRAKIHGAERLHELEAHLKKHSETLHIDHEWMENHGISVIPT